MLGFGVGVWFWDLVLGVGLAGLVLGGCFGGLVLRFGFGFRLTWPDLKSPRWLRRAHHSPTLIAVVELKTSERLWLTSE